VVSPAELMLLAQPSEERALVGRERGGGMGQDVVAKPVHLEAWAVLRQRQAVPRLVRAVQQPESVRQRRVNDRLAQSLESVLGEVRRRLELDRLAEAGW